jgi:hypothetical protein
MKRPDLLPTTFEGSLSRLIEEMCEAGRVIAKIQQHGEIAVDPQTGIRYHNINDLFNELYDVVYAVEECKRLYAGKLAVLLMKEANEQS